MRKTILSSILLLHSLLSFSQDFTPSKEFEYTLSNTYDIVDGTYSILDGVKNYWNKNGEVLAVKFNDDGYVVFQKFSGEQLNEIKRFTSEQYKDITAEAFAEMNGRYYFFYVKRNNATKLKQMYVREIDFESCNWADEEKLLFDVRKEQKQIQYSNLFKAKSLSKDFNFVKSFDGKTLVIQYSLKYGDAKQSNQPLAFQMHSFNAELEELWSTEIEIPITEEQFDLFSAATDNNGNTYLLGINRGIVKGKIVTFNGELSLSPILLYKIDGYSQSLSEEEIDLGENYVAQIGLFAGKNENLIVGGYYKNKIAENTCGIFIYSTGIEEEGKFAFSPLPADELLKHSELKTKEEIKEKKIEGHLIGGIYPREIHFEKDNGYTIIGEKYSYNYTERQIIHKYKEILVSRIDGNGELVWATKLPKNQLSATTNLESYNGGTGYTRIVTEAFEYYLFVDNLKNLTLTENQVPQLHSDGAGGFFSGFKVNRETGEYTRFTIMDFRDVNGIKINRLILSKITYLTDHQFALEFNTDKKKNVMLKFSLND